MPIAFSVLKLQGSQIDPPQGFTGSTNSLGGIELRRLYVKLIGAFYKTLKATLKVLTSMEAISIYLCQYLKKWILQKWLTLTNYNLAIEGHQGQSKIFNIILSLQDFVLN